MFDLLAGQARRRRRARPGRDRHRRRRVRHRRPAVARPRPPQREAGVLGRLGRFSERVSGLPAWAAIPAGIIVVSLITALFGMLWDISLHIAQGRDEGPLANPAHYFILAGLFGIFAAGFLVDVPAAGEAVARGGPDRRRLVRAARRRADRGRGRLLADRLPARRRLAPAVRPGRDALGPDPPDADRRRGDDADRPGRAARRGGRRDARAPARARGSCSLRRSRCRARS